MIRVQNALDLQTFSDIDEYRSTAFPEVYVPPEFR